MLFQQLRRGIHCRWRSLYERNDRLKARLGERRSLLLSDRDAFFDLAAAVHGCYLLRLASSLEELRALLLVVREGDIKLDSREKCEIVNECDIKLSKVDAVYGRTQR